MNRRQANRLLVHGLGVAAAFAAFSRGGLPREAAAAEVLYSTRPYEHRGVLIVAQKVFLKGKKLWFRLNVVNNTGKLLTIDKNQILLKVGGGQLARDQGVFGKYGKPHMLNPGLSHELYVEYVTGEIPQPASLLLGQGFIVDGRSLPLPEYPVAPAAAG